MRPYAPTLAQVAQKVMENVSESDLEQLKDLIDPEMLKQLSQVPTTLKSGQNSLLLRMFHGIMRMRASVLDKNDDLRCVMRRLIPSSCSNRLRYFEESFFGSLTLARHFMHCLF